MQLFTLFRSQNKGLISTPIFTPNSFYNSLPYFTEKPANPWKHYILLRAFSLFYTSSKFHCIISSHSCVFRWYNAIIPNLRQNSNISVRSAGDQSILEVLPAVTQHRTSASGFWEIPGASWPAAQRSRPIPAADNAARTANTVSLSDTQSLWSACHVLLLTRAWSRLP